MTTVLSRSNSDTARQVDKQLAKVNRTLQGSVAIGMLSQVDGELADVYMECSEPDWDGHNAFPVDPDSYLLAKHFLLSLPLGIRRPSVGAEPDGMMTLEWYSGVRRTLSISFDPEGKLHYAALIGASRPYGTESFTDDVPQLLLELIRRVS